jgi:GR25 family glycosyltransferase involved in LPS biosynthesis
MAFVNAIADYFDVSSSKVRIELIHLERATERLPLLETLRKALDVPLTVRPAADGRNLIAAGHPIACASGTAKSRSPGEVGCLVSHVEAARAALADGIEYLIVFEDDCVPSKTFSLGRAQAWLAQAKAFRSKFQPAGAGDFLLLSTGGCYAEKILTTQISATNHFNCTHAYVIGRTMMEHLVGSYEHLKKKGQMYPVDGLFGLLLRTKLCWALKPRVDSLLFEQSSTASYVLGDGVAPRS